MKLLSIVVTLIYSVCIANAQSKLFTKTANIAFYSSAVAEKIEASNNKVLSVWVPSDGKIEFSVLMKGFVFEKALMQEHFNDDYVESDKFPKAIFKGTVENSNRINFSEDKSHSLKINGALTLHGVTKPVITTATIQVKKGIASATASFVLLLADYNIKIPSVVSDNVSKQILIVVNVPAYQVMN